MKFITELEPDPTRQWLLFYVTKTLDVEIVPVNKIGITRNSDYHYITTDKILKQNSLLFTDLIVTHENTILDVDIVIIAKELYTYYKKELDILKLLIYNYLDDYGVSRIKITGGTTIDLDTFLDSLFVEETFNKIYCKDFNYSSGSVSGKEREQFLF